MADRSGATNQDFWQTPKWFYDKLDKEFKFDFDPCPKNPTFDGLSVEWGKSNFVNPPYNRVDKPKFVRKAYEEWKKGKTSVLLIPSSTSTKAFHELILPFAEIRFLSERIAFIPPELPWDAKVKGKGKHDSMIVIFRGEP